MDVDDFHQWVYYRYSLTYYSTAMPRPKTQITAHNLMHIYYYLEKSLNELRLFPDNEPELRAKAHVAFDKLPKPKWRDKTSENTLQTALQSWVDKYLSSNIWTRCLANIRQRKFVKKQELVSLKLRWETYYILKSYADNLGLTLEQAIDKAVRPHYEKLR